MLDKFWFLGLQNYTRYGFNTSRTSSSFPSVCIASSMGLDKSRLKIPIMDFASITYLPEIKSKSYSNWVMVLTKDFTLSMEFKDIWRFVSLEQKRHEPYEDNVNFFKTRYSIGTNYTVQVILDSFAEGKELDGKLFLPGVYGGKSYSIRLNALKILYQQIGFQWEPNAGDDWSAYTTSIVR